MEGRRLQPRMQVGESALVGSLRVGGRVAHRWIAGGLIAGVVLLGAAGKSEGQQKKQKRSHRETNAARQARIARTIEDTYSHEWEVTGGGGYLRWKSGEATKKNNEVDWNVAANRYLNSKLAIIVDGQGSFGHAHQQLPVQFPQIGNPQINEYLFTGGASYRFYAKERLALSAQASAGVADGIFSGGAKGLTGPQVGLWNDGFRPAAKVSFNVDYNLDPALAIRISPTYVLTDFTYAPQVTVLSDSGTGTVPTYNSSIQNNLGFNIGIVYRFGRGK